MVKEIMSNLHLWDLETINQMDQRYRAQFINSLPGFKTPFLLGTQNNSAQTNLSIISSVTHLGSHPPLMSLIMRPNTVERHSIENIKDTRFFTLNAVPAIRFKDAHQTSARYDREISEFDACGFTPFYEKDFIAPFVQESPLQIGLSLAQIIHLDINGCDMVIGKIEMIKAPFSSLSEDGSIKLEQLDLCSVSGLDRYYGHTKIARLSYAKPDKKPSVID